MVIHFQRRLINSLKGRLIVCIFFVYCGYSEGEGKSLTPLPPTGRYMKVSLKPDLFVSCLRQASYQNASCPDSLWLLFRRSCYFYQHSEPNIDWKTAVSRCSGWQAHLVDIRDLDEWEFVRKNARSSVWQYRIGMTDQATEGVWRFQDGSTVNFTKWAPPEEPNGGEKENCATFFGETTKLGLYNDGPCTYQYNAYICKKDVVAVKHKPKRSTSLLWLVPIAIVVCLVVLLGPVPQNPD